ncbi:hypothetical protein [Winogradskyella aquimaris]|uniref:Uncharacterized protein n=1 Tax=Winogradskyella aquimaris TaxID=864074 RepID=A0ABU5ENW1_9FLAO|nr:hypothetical protein [Winogradskyella aquimaris]MDY2587741.1 hypothetical protein [Winogradskyella aquimaris]
MKKEKLHNIKSNGFKVPDNYFDTVEDAFFNRLNKKDSIEGIITTGFKTPEGYFDSVEHNIISKLNDKPVISLYSRKALYYISGIAASLVLLFAIFINNDNNTEDISAEMVTTYFENSDLDSYELAELLAKAEIIDTDFKVMETDFNEEHLESYLLENTDIETILQQ